MTHCRFDEKHAAVERMSARPTKDSRLRGPFAARAPLSCAGRIEPLLTKRFAKSSRASGDISRRRQLSARIGAKNHRAEPDRTRRPPGEVRHHSVTKCTSPPMVRKKVQTQIVIDREGVEHCGNQLRKSWRSLRMFGRLDIQPSFVQHTQTQMEELVRDAFDRARASLQRPRTPLPPIYRRNSAPRPRGAGRLQRSVGERPPRLLLICSEPRGE